MCPSELDRGKAEGVRIGILNALIDDLPALTVSDRPIPDFPEHDASVSWIVHQKLMGTNLADLSPSINSRLWHSF
jgi:hypothetical protein